MALFDFTRRKQLNGTMSWTLLNGVWTYPDNNADAYVRAYKSLPNVYAIIDLITDKSASVPFKVYKITNKAAYQKYKAQMKTLKTGRDIADAVRTKDQALEAVNAPRVEKLLNNPNSFTGYEELNKATDGYKLLTGNSYTYAVGGGRPTELYSIPSPIVKIKSGTWDKPVKGYKFGWFDQMIPAEDVAHFKVWNPLTSNMTTSQQLYGMSPLMSCRKLLGRYADADITQGSLFKKQAPQGVLSSDGESVTDEQATAIRDRYKQQYGGKKAIGDIIVTSAKLSWQKIGLSPVDLNIEAAKEGMLSELCNAYHVPIGLFSQKNSTENNMIESRKGLITDAVIPLVEQRKHVYNRWLMPKFGENLVIEYDYTVFNELREDLNELADAAKTMWWLTPNEKRELTNAERLEDESMDKVFIPTGLQPIEDATTAIPEINANLLNPNSNV